jgi:hypothetical protein
MAKNYIRPKRDQKGVQEWMTKKEEEERIIRAAMTNLNLIMIS